MVSLDDLLAECFDNKGSAAAAQLHAVGARRTGSGADSCTFAADRHGW